MTKNVNEKDIKDFLMLILEQSLTLGSSKIYVSHNQILESLGFETDIDMLLFLNRLKSAEYIEFSEYMGNYTLLDFQCRVTDKGTQFLYNDSSNEINVNIENTIIVNLKITEGFNKFNTLELSDEENETISELKDLIKNDISPMKKVKYVGMKLDNIVTRYGPVALEAAGLILRGITGT